MTSAIAAALLLASAVAASEPDLIVNARMPDESTGTMHYADSLRLQIGDAKPLVLEIAPVPLPGPHFRLPAGRFLLLGWSSPGAGMQSMHALLISARNHAVRLDRELTVSMDRSTSGLLLRFRSDGGVQIGIPEPEDWGSDPEMWFVDAGGGAKPLGFDAMHRLKFELAGHNENDVFYDGGRPAKPAPKRVAWVEVTTDEFRIEMARSKRRAP